MIIQNSQGISSKLRVLTRSALMASIFIIFAQIRFPLPFTPVPITLQTLGIILCASLLRPKESLYPVILYILMGAIGLPVFAGGNSGPAYLLGPTGGFIISWIPSVFIMSFITEKALTSKYASKNIYAYIIYLLSIVIFTLMVYFIGIIWFMASTGSNLMASISACMLPFIPGDIIKGLIALIAFPYIRNIRQNIM
ncbi:MAG: biotin transporter BioY [Lachnospiraceae bacterium]|jgi:biotin transport system substrate-specific component|nr:biotin transporter BioY [Lachnospiraceae bacterium]